MLTPPSSPQVQPQEQGTPPRQPRPSHEYLQFPFPSPPAARQRLWSVGDDDPLADDEMCRLSGGGPTYSSWDSRSSPDSCSPEACSPEACSSHGSVTPIQMPTRAKRSRSAQSPDDEEVETNNWSDALDKLIDLFQKRRYIDSRRYMTKNREALRIARQRDLPIVRRAVVYRSTIVMTILLQNGWFDDCDVSYLYDSLLVLCKHASATSVALFLYHSSIASRFGLIWVSRLRVRLDSFVRETLDPVILGRRPGWQASLARKHIIDSAMDVLDDWIRGFSDGKLILVM